MQLIPWKLFLVVLVLHAVLLTAMAQFGFQSLDYGAQSVVSIQMIESKSSAPVNRVVSQSMAEHTLPKLLRAEDHSSARNDALSTSMQGNTGELMSALITPPSADLLELRNPKPPYPIASRENGEQGAVMLYACISDHGKVERLDLAQSSGHPALDRSALNTVRNWSFRPAQESGKSIPMCYRLPIRFFLSSSTLLALFA